MGSVGVNGGVCESGGRGSSRRSGADGGRSAGF